MTRRLLVGVVVLVLALLAATGGGYWYYSQQTAGTPPPPAPTFVDAGDRLPTQEEFDKLAETDPVAMLAACLTRYQREVKGGMQATLEKQERVQGKPKHPEMPPVEVIDLFVRGELPDPKTNESAVEVLMKWRSGAKKAFGFGAEIKGTLFSEKPDSKVVTWRPEASKWPKDLRETELPASSDLAKTQSRYYIRDAGIYRGMDRAYKAWEARKQAGTLKTEYLGKRKLEKAGGRECHVVKRLCPQPEVDAFAIGGTPSTDPKVIAAEGFTEVTLYIDAERWLQLGSELYRTEPDGTRVLIGAYYFRDVTLNPTFAPDTFTRDGLKK
jgi:hypothetical protein